MYLKPQLSKTLLILTLGLLLGGGLFNLSANDSSLDEDHQTKDLEDLLDKYQKDSNAVLESYSNFDEEGNTLSEEDIKSLEGSVKKKAVDKDYIHALKKRSKGEEELSLKEQVALALSPLQNLDDRRLTEFLNQAIHQSKISIISEKVPGFVDLLKRMIKSKDAIPGIVNISADKRKLIFFLGAILASLIISFVSKKFFYGKNSGCLGIIVGFVLHVLFMMAIRVGIIIYFFGEDLKPTFKIVTSWLGNQF